MVRHLEHDLTKRARQIEEALALLLSPETVFPPIIHEAMRYSALGGGKRLRGILVMETFSLAHETSPALPLGEAVDEEEVTWLPSKAHITAAQMAAVGPAAAVAAAIEMIHAYSLVHDDLPAMDDDDLRRGRPTNHKVFGEGIAILAGDALLTRAFEVLSRLPWAGVSPSKTLRIIETVAVAAGTGGLIGGQTADLQAERMLHRPDEDRILGAPDELLSYIHLCKTAALIRCSVRCGALLAGLDATSIKQVDMYGQALGLAFQIVDDLLDLRGDASRLGKETGSDEQQGKLTYPALYGIEKAEAMARENIDKAKSALDHFGREADFLRAVADYVALRDH